MRKLATIASALTLSAAAGCTTDDTMRIDGLTPGAGNAIAVNTVLQMADPWQPGVQHADLKVPAERTLSSASAKEAGSGNKSTTADD